MTCGPLFSYALSVSVVWGLLYKSLKHNNYYYRKKKKEDDEDGHEDHAKTGNIVFIYNCDYIHISILF